MWLALKRWVIKPYNSWVKHLFFTLIFAVLLLKYKYNTNNEFSFTITTRPHSILLSKTVKIEWFKGYSTLYVSKMVVAAILDFVKMLYLTYLSESRSPMLLSRRIWWQSVERFEIDSTLLIFKMAVAAILNLVKILYLTNLS